MNLFYLDLDPKLAARAHNDRHVVKMILETAQLLSTAHHFLDGPETARSRVPAILRPTHVNHPCALWIRASSSNYAWARLLMDYLLEEHRERYPDSRPHALTSLSYSLRLRPLGLPVGALTEPVQVVAPCCHRSSPVEAYRAYYRTHKRHIATWRLPRRPPDWWGDPVHHELRVASNGG